MDEIYLPLAPGTKRPPLIAAWNAIPPPRVVIRQDQNRAKRLDDDVDIDADCREARDAAPFFLPHTGRRHGRPSVGTTHWWFKADGAQSESFLDVVQVQTEEGRPVYPTLIEIRTGNGQYTVIPPSRVPISKDKPELETLQWFADDEPGACEFPFLRQQVVHIAITSLLARHFAPDGVRWQFYEALSGFLLGSLKIGAAAARQILTRAADIVGDHDTSPGPEEWIDRTERRLRKGDRCIGASHVAELIGEHGPNVVAAIRKWCGADPVLTAVERLNETYFLIDVGTDTVVAEDVPQSDGSRSWSELQFRSFADFKRKLIKQCVQTGTTEKKGEVVPIIKPLSEVWLHHSQGRQYDRLVYAPEGSGISVGPRDLNGWKGLTVAAAPGDWSRTREFVWQVMCREDRRLFEWTLDWMAALFQQPGRHAETALVLTGRQGTGKNFFGEFVLARTFDGRHARVTTHTKQVLGEFNEILSGLCLLVLDEVGLSTDAEYNATKGLITGHTVDINRKHIRLTTERSMLHVVFLSNADVPLKVAGDDRRWA